MYELKLANGRWITVDSQSTRSIEAAMDAIEPTLRQYPLGHALRTVAERQLTTLREELSRLPAYD